MSNLIRQNFIYPTITHEHRIFGATHSIGNVINDLGDWRQYLPPEEYQVKNGIESSGCFIYAQTHTIATILEKQYGLPDKDFSERFNALLSSGTPQGGDPIGGAESFQAYGLINYESMPFSDDIESWYDFHSWKGVDETICRQEGQAFLGQWKINFDIIFERDHPLDYKYNQLRDNLKKSPVPMSVYGEVDSEGNYVPKPSWANDTHMVEAVHLDSDNCIWIWDTYKPCLKKLPANYNPDFGMIWGVEQKIEVPEIKKKNYWDYIISAVKWFFREKLVYREFKKFLIDYYKKK
jgi:hypothetical protein